MENNLYFIFPASCKLVIGFKRCLIIDYTRNQLYFISKEYYDLIRMLDRHLISEMEMELEDDESQQNFKKFMDFMIENELVILTDDASLFPPMSEEVHDEYITIQDAIMEVDENIYDNAIVEKACKELTELGCEELQLRMLNPINLEFLNNVVERIEECEFNYLEIHCLYNPEVNVDSLRMLVETHAILSKLYIYDSPNMRQIDVYNHINGCYDISLGTIYLLENKFNDGNCCGVITFNNLDFSGYAINNKLKTRNGCLDKKVTIDRHGNIKNCPSMSESYGNIKGITIREVLNNPNFTKWWYICKDQIDICKDCEFRYSCTDCRAFTENGDMYRKPTKCGYNPYTGKWVST